MRRLFFFFRSMTGSARPIHGSGVSRRALWSGLLGFGGMMVARPTVAAVPASPWAAMDRVQLDVVLRGLAEVALIGDAPLSAQAKQSLAQIEAVLPEARHLFDLHGLFRDHEGEWWGSKREVSVDLVGVAAACHAGQPLRIGYTDLKGVRTVRVIWPLTLVYPRHGVFVLAWCCERQAYRQFFAHAIDHVAVVPGSFADQRVTLLAGLVSEQRAKRA